MEIKSNYPKLTQKQVAKSLSYTASTLKRYRHDITRQSPCIFSNKGPKRHQVTSKGPVIESAKPTTNADTLSDTRSAKKEMKVSKVVL